MVSYFKHKSVLLQEAVDSLKVQEGAWYVDATAGAGGHTSEILARGGNVLAIDQDLDAIEHLEKRFENENRVVVVRGNFSEVKKLTNQISELPLGILFDLGVSSYQLDSSGRGFSFMREENLDMRMSDRNELTAEVIVNTYTKENLYEIFAKYGEESDAEQIADSIFRARRVKPIKTTSELVDIIKGVSKERRIHPGTRIFQALRIEVNKEMDVLSEALWESIELVGEKGRLVVISFHSLEDRIVKMFMEKAEEKGLGKILTKKPITPKWSEVKKNPRSRSAKMRVFEKI